MEFRNATVIPLHQNWKYLDTCCDLLNEEWPRSVTARMHSLRASCDNFPISLILLARDPETNEELVIGHSKISSMHNYPSACFVESVVVMKMLRGRGWGRYIMEESEKFVKGKGKTVIFLTTSDKEEFYEKLGYNRCEPVSIYGCKSFQMKNTNHLRPLYTNVLNSNGSQDRQAPAPPPLPPPKEPRIMKVYMMKDLA